MPEISVIILNWNKAEETLRCLESLRQARLEDVEVIVVDNGSTDGSSGRIRGAFPAVTMIETGANLGYAAGNNTGIRHALAKGTRFVFVLNNDTGVAPDALDCLLDAVRRFPRAAFFGPKLLHLEAPDRVQSTGIWLDFYWRSHQLGADAPDRPGDLSPRQVECVSGAAIFIRAEALEKIGLIDPDFFLYREDIDWCLRARRQGFQIVHVPGARVWHRSHAVREVDLPRITYYMTRNSLLLLRKHHGGWIRSGGLLLRSLLTAFAWTFYPRWRNKKRERGALLQAIGDFFQRRFGQGPF
jgi:GT2 family glycosyltransferase